LLSSNFKSRPSFCVAKKWFKILSFTLSFFIRIENLSLSYSTFLHFKLVSHELELKCTK
jgi:hypothetical protein